jgi:hypothetical protein
MFKYFKLKEAFSEAKTEFAIGDLLEKTTSLAKLTGKTAANVGMLTAELAIEAGAFVIKNHQEITGKFAEKVLKEGTDISDDQREQLEKTVLAGKVHAKERYENTRTKPNKDESLKPLDSIFGNQEKYLGSRDDEALLKFCKRFAIPRHLSEEMAVDRGGSLLDYRNDINKDIAYYAAADIPDHLDERVRGRLGVKNSEKIIFLSDLCNSEESFGDAFVVTSNGIYSKGKNTRWTKEMTNIFINWEMLTKMSVVDEFGDANHTGIQFDDQTIILCCRRNESISFFGDILVKDLIKRCGKSKRL